MLHKLRGLRKTKEFRKRKKLKEMQQKMKKNGNLLDNDDEEPLTDDVAFGEVAERPPEFNALPKMKHKVMISNTC